MRLHTFPTLDAVQEAVLDHLFEYGAAAAPRGANTIELIASGFTLDEPRARTIANPVRGWSKALAVGELAWHVSASDNVDALAFYAPAWRRFSEDGTHIRGSCYGKRIFEREDEGLSQWEALVRLLKSDPASRRAIVSVQQKHDLTLAVGSLDVPCVTTCQFLLRDGALDAIVHMRSNDVIWGLPYDVFLFTMIQEMLALELGVELGRYHHFAGSLHLYERHFDLGRRILASSSTGEIMAPMTDLDQVGRFAAAERALRLEGIYDDHLAPYWSNLLKPAQDLVLKRSAERPPAHA